MSKWDGKSKGTLLGYKIFVFCIRKLGIKASYFVLFFVASYYFLFLKSSNRAIFYYLNKRLKYSFAFILSWCPQLLHTQLFALLSSTDTITLHFGHLCHNPSGVSFLSLVSV